jgi:hypothetical protein
MRAWIVEYRSEEREHLPFVAVAGWLVKCLRPLLPHNHDPSFTGLYLATPDAGAQASIAFWSEVLAQGAAFANPRDFPWTLASSPAGHVAMELDIRGPNYTLVGRVHAALAAFQHALADIANGRIEVALVAQLDTTQASRVAALLLSRTQPTDRFTLLTWQHGEEEADIEETDLLAQLCRTIAEGKNWQAGPLTIRHQ